MREERVRDRLGLKAVGGAPVRLAGRGLGDDQQPVGVINLIQAGEEIAWGAVPPAECLPDALVPVVGVVDAELADRQFVGHEDLGEVDHCDTSSGAGWSSILRGGQNSAAQRTRMSSARQSQFHKSVKSCS